MNNKIFAVAILCLTLASCASIVETPMQKVTVLTPGTEDAMCMLKRPGLVYKVFPPETITINKNEEDMVVHCMAQGNRDKILIVEPQVSSTAMANLSNGVVPGVLYDYHSGALYKYPDVIAVDFTGTYGMGYDYPPHMNADVAKATLHSLEDMGPDSPSIPQDLINARRLSEANASYAYDQEREARKEAVGFYDWDK
ncbi:MAG: hypothetical protein CMH28_00930 [Micavibrio sp.]|nr:hypothetical protein [Micavibrio sp.]